MVDQPFDHFGMAFSSRKHQRRLTISITRIDIGSARQQALKLIDGSAAYGVFLLIRHAAALQVERTHYDSGGRPGWAQSPAADAGPDGIV